MPARGRAPLGPAPRPFQTARPGRPGLRGAAVLPAILGETVATAGWPPASPSRRCDRSRPISSSSQSTGRRWLASASRRGKGARGSRAAGRWGSQEAVRCAGRRARRVRPELAHIRACAGAETWSSDVSKVVTLRSTVCACVFVCAGESVLPRVKIIQKPLFSQHARRQPLSKSSRSPEDPEDRGRDGPRQTM